MRVLVGVCAAACVAFGAGSAGAVDYLFDNFNSEEDPSVQFALNYNAFQNFNVFDGTVDLVSDGEFGIDTGQGFFVDLDGSTGNGGHIETKLDYAFSAGDRVFLTFEVSGNQRNASTDDNDNLFAGFRFLSGSYSNVQLTGFTSTQTPGDILEGVQTQVPWDMGWTTYGISFTAQSAGTFRALIGTGSTRDNEGPLIDDIRFGTTVVPEPATWAMMILGFGGVGTMLRTRRRVAAA